MVMMMVMMLMTVGGGDDDGCVDGINDDDRSAHVKKQDSFAERLAS